MNTTHEISTQPEAVVKAGTLPRKDISAMVADAEALMGAHKKQGWKQPDFAAALRRMVDLDVGGPAAIYVDQAQNVVMVGSAKFSIAEAGYIRAHAGCSVSGDNLASPLGITDSADKRWLLVTLERGEITLERHDIRYQLRAEQVITAFFQALAW